MLLTFGAILLVFLVLDVHSSFLEFSSDPPSEKITDILQDAQAPSDGLNWMVRQKTELIFTSDSADNVIVAGIMDFINRGDIWCYSGVNGSQLWYLNLSAPLEYPVCNTRSLQSLGERVVVLTGDCSKESHCYTTDCLVRVVAIDTKSGSIIWKHTALGFIEEVDTLVDGKGYLYVAYSKPNNISALQLHKLSGGDGSITWTIDMPFPHPNFSSLKSAIAPSGLTLYYLSNTDRMMIGVDATTGDIMMNYSLWTYPGYNGVPQFGTPYFLNDGTMIIIADNYLVCFNPDNTLRYWTTNFTVSGGEITFDEKRNMAYVGFLTVPLSYYYENWQAYDPYTGLQYWNFTYLINVGEIVNNYPPHAPLVRQSDGLLVYIQKSTFIGREFGTGKVVFNTTVPFTDPGQVTAPVIRKDGTAFYVSVVYLTWIEIWSVPLPPVTTPEYPDKFITNKKEQTSWINKRRSASYWQQCGSQCKSYSDCDGYTCSQCINGTCVQPFANSTSCNHRGDCDERLFTCISLRCLTVSPGCGGRCDYWAQCSGSCHTCSYRCQSIQ